MKKVISLLLCVVLVFSLSATAFADSEYELNTADLVDPAIQYESDAQNSINELQTVITYGNSLNPTFITRGTSRPTSAYTFDETNPYSASFSGVSAGIYSSYYFTGHTKYNVSFRNVTVSANCNFIFYLYDMTGGYIVNNTSEVGFTKGTNNEAYASYDTIGDHCYYVFCRTNSTATASGTMKVSYSY